MARGELGPLELARRADHRDGGKFTPAEAVERVCGGPLSVEPFLEQMQAKVAALYG